MCNIGAIERVMADCIAVLAVTAIVLLQLAGALTEPSCPVKQGKEQKTLTRVMYASYLATMLTMNIATSPAEAW